MVGGTKTPGWSPTRQDYSKQMLCFVFFHSIASSILPLDGSTQDGLKSRDWCIGQECAVAYGISFSV